MPVDDRDRDPGERRRGGAGSDTLVPALLLQDRAVTEALLAEAVASGYGAIELTVDAPFAGWRERDLRTGFAADVTAPAVQAAIGSDRPITTQELFSLVDASLDWDAFAALCRGCELPILLKGLMAPADAELAIEAGAGGIVVSNHGGRQLDGVPAAVDALPAVADAVAGRVPVLMDGGVRRGTDVLVALALGADAVQVGRPPLWGLAVDGEAGARKVLELLREEIKLALALLGCPTPADVTRAHVQHAGALEMPSARTLWARAPGNRLSAELIIAAGPAPPAEAPSRRAGFEAPCRGPGSCRG